MSDMAKDTVTTAFLDKFAEAWNRHDVDGILSMMTDDCVFQPGMGPHAHGNRFSGQADVRRGIERFLAAFPDARWNDPKHFVAGSRGVTEWLFTATGPDGPIETYGCDVFTFSNGKISVKDSYRKQRVR